MILYIINKIKTKPVYNQCAVNISMIDNKAPRSDFMLMQPIM